MIMMIKSVLVSLTRFNSNEAAVLTALALARSHDAQLTAVPADDCRTAFAPMLAKRMDESGDVAALGPRPSRGRPSRRVDLAVIGGTNVPRRSDDAELGFRDVLARSRSSVLVVPSARLPTAFCRIAVLWEKTRHSARIIGDATALLAPGAVIEILAFVPGGAERWPDEDAFVAIVVQLLSDGFIVHPRLARDRDSGRAAAVVRFAGERHADLVIVPSPRVRALGDERHSAFATEIFRHARAPVLFAR